MTEAAEFVAIAARTHPFDLLPEEALAEAAAYATRQRLGPGGCLHRAGEAVDGLWIVAEGEIALEGPDGEAVSTRGPGETVCVREALRGQPAANGAVARAPSTLYMLHRSMMDDLMSAHPDFAEAFSRFAPRPAAEAQGGESGDLMSIKIADLMTADPVTVAPSGTVQDAARIIRDRDISCLPVVVEDNLAGILTTGDIADRVVAEGLPADTPVSAAMTPDPLTVGPEALGFDALLLMSERRIAHLPVAEGGRLVGILTSTNLVKRQTASAVFLVSDIARRSEAEGFAEATARIPTMLAQMTGAGVSAYDIGRIVTSVTDALTRRLVALAEEALGPPPVPYIWAACGSQGRREQTGVSDQDNCLILSDAYDEAAHGEWFEALARRVCDGLNDAGYVFCPGDMMATNPRWRQPLAVWRGYFRKWIAQPTEEAQMLASVMFDLRAISGETALFSGLQEETLAAAKKNSIFRAHMAKNALKHRPPLSLFGGMATIGSGEHKNRIDMKHSGTVPIVDLGRLYALMGEFTEANTRDRLIAARDAKLVSPSGANDLIDAFDLIAEMRLEHQARLIRAGEKPDNFMAPAMLSELERGHLKDAFAVVKTMQASAANSYAMGG